MFAAHDHINLQISSESEKPPAIVNLFLDCYACVCVCVCVCVCQRDTGIERVQILALFSEISLAMRFQHPADRLASWEIFFPIKHLTSSSKYVHHMLQHLITRRLFNAVYFFLQFSQQTLITSLKRIIDLCNGEICCGRHNWIFIYKYIR